MTIQLTPHDLFKLSGRRYLRGSPLWPNQNARPSVRLALPFQQSPLMILSTRVKIAVRALPPHPSFGASSSSTPHSLSRCSEIRGLASQRVWRPPPCCAP